MLDLNFVRDNLDKVRDALTTRQFPTVALDDFARADAERRHAARRGDPVRIEGVSDPDDPEQALYASGALLPGPDAVLAGPTFRRVIGERS